MEGLRLHFYIYFKHFTSKRRWEWCVSYLWHEKETNFIWKLEKCRDVEFKDANTLPHMQSFGHVWPTYLFMSTQLLTRGSDCIWFNKIVIYFMYSALTVTFSSHMCFFCPLINKLLSCIYIWIHIWNVCILKQQRGQKRVPQNLIKVQWTKLVFWTDKNLCLSIQIKSLYWSVLFQRLSIYLPLKNCLWPRNMTMYHEQNTSESIACACDRPGYTEISTQPRQYYRIITNAATVLKLLYASNSSKAGSDTQRKNVTVALYERDLLRSMGIIHLLALSYLTSKWHDATSVWKQKNKVLVAERIFCPKANANARKLQYQGEKRQGLCVGCR